MTAYRAQLSLALAYAAQYRFEDAQREAEASLAERQALLPKHHPDVLNCQKELARIHYRAGDEPAALSLIEQSLKTMQGVGNRSLRH